MAAPKHYARKWRDAADPNWRTHAWNEGLPVACAWCRPREVCCRCLGTLRVPWNLTALSNAWDVPGCECQTCLRLRAMRLAIERADDQPKFRKRDRQRGGR